MNTRLQIIIAVMIVAALVYLIYMVRTRALQLRYALSWMVVGVIVLILDIFPPLINVLSSLLGIARPINMLFFFGIIFALALIFVLTVAISRNSIRIKQLTQEIALRDAKIRELMGVSTLDKKSDEDKTRDN